MNGYNVSQFRLGCIALVVAITALSLGAANTVSAQNSAGQPVEFYGDITNENGTPAPTGIEVYATIDGSVEDRTEVTETGEYGSFEDLSNRLTVNNGAGNEIRFTVNDPDGTESIRGPYNLTKFSSINELNLTFPTGTFIEEEKEDDLPPEPPRFAVEDLTPSDATVKAGQEFGVYADITNTGAQAGTTLIELRLEPDGTIVDTTTVTLDGGETTRVTFDSVSVPTAGEYNHVVASDAGDTATGNLMVSPPIESSPIVENTVSLSGSTITINTSEKNSISVSNLPESVNIDNVSDGGTFNSDERSILYTDFGDGLPTTVTFRLDPDDGAYTSGDTIAFTVDGTQATLGVSTVPPELQGDVSAEQYAAVLDGDDTLSASNLADAVNGWADNGKINGVGIGAFELSNLINYWADS